MSKSSIRLIVFSLCLVRSDLANAQETAQTILDKSNAAMSAPVQYRVVSGNTESLVSKKQMPDGSVAVRIEVNGPLQMISMVLGDGAESYEIYPDYSVMIDTRFRVGQAKAIKDSLLNVANHETRRSAEIKPSVKRFGTECYVVESHLPSGALTGVTAALSESVRSVIPEIQRSFVDAETYVLRGTDFLSEGGSLLSETRYRDVVIGAELPDELFLPPNGYELKVPESNKEHRELLVGMITQPRLKAARQAIRDLKQRIASPPLADTAPPSRPDLSEIKELVASRHRDRVSETAEPPSQSHSGRWLLLLGINGFVVVIIAIVIFWRGRR